MWEHMYGYGPGMGMWGGGILMLLFWLVVLGMLVAAGVVLMRGFSRTPRRPVRGALDILEERYARGEIGTSEYRERREELEGGGH